MNVTPVLATYAFDTAAYSAYLVGRFADSSATPLQLSPRTRTFVVSSRVSTPQFRRFAASAGVSLGNDVDFFETSRVRRTDFNANIDWRPTEQVRVNASYLSSAFARLSDNEVITTTRIPRVKLEYQLSRSIFVRFVGQYEALTRRPLTDPRTGLPIGLRSGDGYTIVTGSESNALRVDWLFSYRPTPGTVFFAGWQQPHGAGSAGVQRPAADDRRILRQAQLPVPTLIGRRGRRRQV